MPWNDVSSGFPSLLSFLLYLSMFMRHSSFPPLKHARVINACLLPVQNENKFKCPCHGSQYNAEGKVVRGPAPLVRLSVRFCALLCPALPFALWHHPQSPNLISTSVVQAYDVACQGRV